VNIVKRVVRDRRAPAGMFRLLVVDAFTMPPGTGHQIIGDYGTPLVARAEGVRWIGDNSWLKAHIYDDLGRCCWSSRPAH